MGWGGKGEEHPTAISGWGKLYACGKECVVDAVALKSVGDFQPISNQVMSVVRIAAASVAEGGASLWVGPDSQSTCTLCAS